VSDSIHVRPATAADRPWIEDLLRGSWESTVVVSRGVAHDAAQLPALIATRDGAAIGLATYRVEGGECEIVSLDAVEPRGGAGTALLIAAADEARRLGCRRLWLITSNDNLDALRFYQRRGMRLVAVHRDAIEEARRLKPAIPATGGYGIPIRDELELELPL
jgi:N-acetylglutamate synthase-like GNAT family acetyltransferase